MMNARLFMINFGIKLVKPVLRGHLWDKEKWSYKRGDLFKEIHFT
jgi:hypothetical protein